MSRSSPVMSSELAVYFAAFWGIDALQILTSPLHGLGELLRSELIFTVANLLGIGPDGLLRLGAFLGMVSLTIAGLFALHLIERWRQVAPLSHQVTLELALTSSLVWTIVLAIPALALGDLGSMRLYAAQLVLAAVAMVLNEFERPDPEEVTRHRADGSAYVTAGSGLPYSLEPISW